MARVSLIVGAVLAALVLAVLAVGWSLPERHRATRSIVLAVPPDTVFALIADVASAPSWRSGVTEVEILARIPAGDVARYREHSSGDVVTYEVVERMEGRRFVTRIADPDLPYGGTWTFDLEPHAGGTRLRITEDGEVRNPIFRFMSRFVFGHAHTIETYLGDVARSFGGTASLEP